jgi:catechol 2,3-dioxygenase-like lactoylglutathione lyase family enzyme
MAEIAQMATVFVPVSDQERALEFYVETLGFEKRSDFNYDTGERWVEVVPGGTPTSVSLVAARDGEPAGIETRITFTTPDIDAYYAELRDRGVEVDAEIMREGHPVVYWGGAPLAGMPPMFRLRDPDGNSFLIVQQI